jgi:hypothetical protein
VSDVVEKTWPCDFPTVHVPHYSPDYCHGGRVWVCENSWHDTDRCTPTKHYGRS